VTSPTERLATAASTVLSRRLSRRGFFARAAVVGSAVTANGLDYILHPGTAYASVCGSGNTCSSGWTAMCCTINHGVNQCPPGTFAGGWWKAEGANLCGGSARYYVDCQAECSHCGCPGGSHFCPEHCWDCKPHCAHHGTCDERRVCHNVFRYGQCELDRKCGGPVVCRAISCTPPWRWANCTTTAATDNFTVSHSAPCLPGWSHIQKRYTELGSQSSVLGTTVGREHVTEHGHTQHYEHGRMYWSRHTGAHYLDGSVLHHYLHLHQASSVLGLPVTDVETTRDKHGKRARFQHGGIYHQHGGETHALWGAIWHRWRDLDGTAGPLGYPTTEIRPLHQDQGDFARFTGGSLYRPKGRSPYLLLGEIAAKYHQLGAETSPVGLPTADQHPAVDAKGVAGTELLCAAGAITRITGRPQAHGVWGPIYTTWNDQGRAGGELGFPVTDVTDVTLPDGPGQQCTFEYGVATYDQTTGEVTVRTG